MMEPRERPASASTLRGFLLKKHSQGSKSSMMVRGLLSQGAATGARWRSCKATTPVCPGKRPRRPPSKQVSMLATA
jgi:hypothetical protein